MDIYNRNDNDQFSVNELAEVREFLQILAVAKIDDIPSSSINNLAGILVYKIDEFDKKNDTKIK